MKETVQGSTIAFMSVLAILLISINATKKTKKNPQINCWTWYWEGGMYFLTSLNHQFLINNTLFIYIFLIYYSKFFKYIEWRKSMYIFIFVIYLPINFLSEFKGLVMLCSRFRSYLLIICYCLVWRSIKWTSFHHHVD